MNERVKTMFVAGSDGKPKRINAADYDADKHGQPVEPGKIGDGTVKQTFEGDMTNTGGQRVEGTEQRVALQPPLQASPVAGTTITEGHAPDAGVQTNAPDQPVQMLVASEGRKHFVVNAKGEHVTGVEGIDETGYSKQEAAWAAIMALQPKA